MRIWFDVNRYELKNYPLGNSIGNKKPPEGGLLTEKYDFIVCFFVLVDDKFNVTFDLCFLGFG